MNKKYVYLVFCFQILFVIGWAMLGHSNVKKQEFEGTITYKYNIREAHNAMFLFVDTGKDEISIGNGDLFKRAEKGDYVIKRKGETFYTLIKTNDSTGNRDTEIFETQPHTD